MYLTGRSSSSRGCIYGDGELDFVRRAATWSGNSKANCSGIGSRTGNDFSFSRGTAMKIKKRRLRKPQRPPSSYGCNRDLTGEEQFASDFDDLLRCYLFETDDVWVGHRKTFQSGPLTVWKQSDWRWRRA
jgi:hypothetical protein